MLAIVDGESLCVLEPVMDHKQVGDGDTGPNTGGMGVYSPVALFNRRLQWQVEQNVLAAELVDRTKVWEIIDRVAATHGGTPR